MASTTQPLANDVSVIVRILSQHGSYCLYETNDKFRIHVRILRRRNYTLALLRNVFKNRELALRAD